MKRLSVLVRKGQVFTALLLALLPAIVAADTPIEPVDRPDPDSTVSGACALPPISGDRLDRYVVAVPELNLRAGPGLDCPINGELALDDAIYVIGDAASRDELEWVPVATSLGVGYVYLGSLVTPGDAEDCGHLDSIAGGVGEAMVTNDAVNLRSGPGLGCEILAELTPGTAVQVIGDDIPFDDYTWVPVETPLGSGFVYDGGLAVPGSVSLPARIPVLMYHDIGDPASRFRVSPDQLDEQLTWLSDNGYAAVTPDDLVRFLDSGGPLPERPVILTVDDGSASALIFADLIASHGFAGTYMLPNYANLTSEEIRWLDQNGEVCGHTVSHQFLADLAYADQVYEVDDNKTWLESIVGHKIECFAYPFGSFNEVTTQVVIDAGYRIAFHAWHGPAPLDGSLDRWHVQRIEVDGDYSLDTFTQAVTGLV
jgi:peptidoglycan/xylan/chitin deacetylase (PgdA/CDA1 family)/uncharacterized protein YgiM (DUF1202 family)